MQTHEDGRFYFYCDTPGCHYAYRANPLASQQDAIALSSLDGWLHAGSAHYCPDHAKAGVDFPMANFPLATLPADGLPVQETLDTLGTEGRDNSETGVVNTPVQPGAGEHLPSAAEEADKPPKADDAVEPLATESHEGPEASTQSG